MKPGKRLAGPLSGEDRRSPAAGQFSMRKNKRKRDALSFEESAMSGTVLFLGAGATKSEQGLLTDEILPALLAAMVSLEQQDPSGRMIRLVDFLT